jgi:hypothetical protein
VSAVNGAGEPKEHMTPGVELSFGGLKRVVPPLSLGALEALQERIAKFKGGFDKESVATVIDAVHACLSRNYSGVTREFVAESLDMANMFTFMNAAMNISGLAPKELNGAGKPTAVESSTGATSTAT